MPNAAQLIILAEVARRPGVVGDTERQIAQDRRWRLDLAWPSQMLGVEIHGSTWRQGRHTRGRGFLDDSENLGNLSKTTNRKGGF